MYIIFNVEQEDAFPRTDRLTGFCSHRSREKTCSAAQSEKDMNGFFAFHFREMRIYAANYF